MTKAAHTPTPWTWIEGSPDIFTMWNNKEVVLSTVKHPIWHDDRLCGSAEAAANAAHIVKCVNMHDELVAALETMVGVIDYYASLKKEDQPNIEDWAYSSSGHEMGIARAVLKKAGAI